MAFPTQTLTIDDVVTRYAHNKIGGREFKDQKYQARRVLRLLRERKLSGAGGGQSIVHPVNLGTSANGGSLARNQTFDIQGDVNETWARYAWKTLFETCFISWWDIRETQGNKMKMVTVMDSRISETRENLEDTMESQVCQTAKANSNDLNTIMEFVATSGAFGNLNPATAGQTTWAAKNEDTIDWSAAGVNRTRKAINEVEDDKGATDVIILPDTFYNETCEEGDSKLQLNQDIKTRGGTKYADLGAQVPIILNTPVIRSPAWNTNQSATGVGLDLSGIHLVVDPPWDMYMYPFKQMANHGRLGVASVMVCACELTGSSRRTQFSLTTIS